VGGEPLAGLVSGRVWPPMPGSGFTGHAGQGAVCPGQGGVPGPHLGLHRRGDTVGASGDDAKR